MFWFILPFLAGLGGTLAAVAATALVITWIVDLMSSPDESTRSIAILGMKGAGKTTLWNLLRGKKLGESRATQKEKIQKFSMKKPDGSSLWISATQDIGGQDTYVLDYKELIKEDSFVYFLFHINDLKDKDTLEEILTRATTINTVIENKNLKKVGVKFVATHWDENKTGCTPDECLSQLERVLGVKRENILIGSLVGSNSLLNRIKGDIAKTGAV